MKQAELRIEEKQEKYAKSKERGMKTLNEIANETHNLQDPYDPTYLPG